MLYLKSMPVKIRRLLAIKLGVKTVLRKKEQSRSIKINQDQSQEGTLGQNPQYYNNEKILGVDQ